MNFNIFSELRRSVGFFCAYFKQLLPYIFICVVPYSAAAMASTLAGGITTNVFIALFIGAISLYLFLVPTFVLSWIVYQIALDIPAKEGWMSLLVPRGDALKFVIMSSLYVLAVLLLYFLCGVISFGVVLCVSFIIEHMPLPYMIKGFLLAFSAVSVFIVFPAWLFRYGFYFPALAAGKPLSLSESFKLGRGFGITVSLVTFPFFLLGILLGIAEMGVMYLYYDARGLSFWQSGPSSLTDTFISSLGEGGMSIIVGLIGAFLTIITAAFGAYIYQAAIIKRA